MAKQYGVDREALARAIEERLSGEVLGSPNPQSEHEYRYCEYRAFLGGRPERRDRVDFDIEPRDMALFQAHFRRFFGHVVLVPKLRETRVLTGFTRLEPPEGAAADNVADISRVERSWLPGIAVRGEGIFLTLRTDALRDWETANPALSERMGRLNTRHRAYLRQRGFPLEDIPPRLLLIHTLAHVLIRQLTFECGYDSSSLRERLYVSTAPQSEMCGVLIYTASGDAEGTLGGLVRQGEPDRLEPTIQAALENAQICSSDPLCIESAGQGSSSLNFAACHACSLLPEIACEQGNRLLDRATLVGSVEHPPVGFFARYGVIDA